MAFNKSPLTMGSAGFGGSRPDVSLGQFRPNTSSAFGVMPGAQQPLPEMAPTSAPSAPPGTPTLSPEDRMALLRIMMERSGGQPEPKASKAPQALPRVGG